MRVVEIDGQPWFVGADVCHVLGLAPNKGHRYDGLAPDEQTKLNRVQLGMKPGRPMIALAESGLYKLIMRSDKPEGATLYRI